MTYSSTKYFYLKNAQGDILGLVDASGNQVVAYTYDAWGKLLSTTGSLASSLGKANPFRYRGYVYDEKTGLYYLQSRYYNPAMGRFINADGEVGKKGDIVGHNLFAYCINNPMNRTDASGQRSVEDGPGSAWTMVTRSGNVVSGGRTVSNPLPEGYEEQFFSNNADEGPDIGADIVSSAASTSGDAAANAVYGMYGGCLHAAGKNVAVLAAKTALAKVGLFSMAFFANDIYEDFRDYNGWDTNFAMMLDGLGLFLAIAAGAYIASLAMVPAAATIATVFTGAAIDYSLNFIKNSCLDKRKRRK